MPLMANVSTSSESANKRLCRHQQQVKVNDWLGGGLGTIHSSKTTKVAQEQKVLSETQREPGSLVAAKLINSS